MEEQTAPRSIFSIVGRITEELLDSLDYFLKRNQTPGSQIEFYFNSLGGSARFAQAFREKIEDFMGANPEVVVTALARDKVFSSAFLCFMAIPKHSRFATAGTFFRYHPMEKVVHAKITTEENGSYVEIQGAKTPLGAFAEECAKDHEAIKLVTSEFKTALLEDSPGLETYLDNGAKIFDTQEALEIGVIANIV